MDDALVVTDREGLVLVDDLEILQNLGIFQVVRKGGELQRFPPLLTRTIAARTYVVQDKRVRNV